ncbi:MAG: TonB-dependent receptor [Cyclobacteriaceae bacterium]
MRKTFIYSLLIFISPLCLVAQTLEGTIVDSVGTSIAGAYIIHLESEHHTHSNHLGKFTFHHVHVGDTLEVRHVGYKIKQTTVTDLSRPMEIKIKESLLQLDEIVVEKTAKSLSLVQRIDLQTNPVSSSQDILRKIPGLFIGQHAGGGKAEQIFLRGFDIDHGTDINITVDGLPVNMVSHAHGQGYSDLHFLIPETIEKIDFGKGPYNSDKGNFATAGYVDFTTKDRLDKSSIGIEIGQFNTLRTVGMFDLTQSDNHDAYLATEYLVSDGPFESPQNFSRLNLMGKFATRFADQSKLSLTASHFTSQWDASGQIPKRAVDAGLITRFGSIDDTEGGQTSRTNLLVNFNRLVNDRTFFKNKAYYTFYEFELYSNFTFFLDDPINSDQVRQKEHRQIFGLESEWNQNVLVNEKEVLLQVGIGLRNDMIYDVELSHTRNRKETLEQFQLGDVNETNVYSYFNAEFDLGKWLINPGIRFDYFDFHYVDQLDSLYNPESKTHFLASPKLNIIYNHTPDLQLFAKYGTGFHSNDSRVVLGGRENLVLPAAYGADLGFIWKPFSRLITNGALWYLFLEQEFVYVGDAGIVEPSGRSRRVGIDVGFRYQLLDWLFLDLDGNYAYSRSIDEPEKAQYIPLAPIVTATGGLSVRKDNFTAGIQTRYMRDRPANDDNSINAEGYIITDLNMGYTLSSLRFEIAIQNLFDRDWNETQFATESRLSFETLPVEEIHFTPGTPFFFKGSINYTF